jgi:hypothetical protein
MEELIFVFRLGIAFSIFVFIWGIIMILVNLLRGFSSEARQIQQYVFRIIHNFLLVSVVANFIVSGKDATGQAAEISTANMVIGILVLALYLFGKLRKQTMMSQLAKNQLYARMIPPVDLKLEIYLMVGSMVFFAICLFYPALVSNDVVNWFNDSIVSIYDTAILGWIFKIVAFFFLVNIILRAANVIGRLVTGQPINPINPMSGMNGGSNPFDQFNARQSNDEEYADFTDVTDEEEENKKDDSNNRIS